MSIYQHALLLLIFIDTNETSSSDKSPDLYSRNSSFGRWSAYRMSWVMVFVLLSECARNCQKYLNCITTVSFHILPPSSFTDHLKIRRSVLWGANGIKRQFYKRCNLCLCLLLRKISFRLQHCRVMTGGRAEEKLHASLTSVRGFEFYLKLQFLPHTKTAFLTSNS
jgi:hypothetical protein